MPQAGMKTLGLHQAHDVLNASLCTLPSRLCYSFQGIRTHFERLIMVLKKPDCGSGECTQSN